VPLPSLATSDFAIFLAVAIAAGGQGPVNADATLVVSVKTHSKSHMGSSKMVVFKGDGKHCMVSWNQ